MLQRLDKPDQTINQIGISRLAIASFEQALRVRLSHQTEFDKRDNLTLLHMGLCLTAFGLFIFPM
ncbi:hypothetical protein, partial [Shewanella algae]|uniref:hypothetical protein n=1 Tax=Shewanella algae TaxID=38313 RepID=UPI001C62C2C1